MGEFKRSSRVVGPKEYEFTESSPRQNQIIDVIPGNWPDLPNSPVAFINISRPPTSQPVMREISKHYGAHYLDFESAKSSMTWSAIDQMLLGPAMHGIARVMMGRILGQDDVRAVILDVPPATNQSRYSLTQYAWRSGAASVVGILVPDTLGTSEEWSEPSAIEDFTVIWRIV